AAAIDGAWRETPLEVEFSLIQQHRADAGLGWLAAAGETLPASLEAMNIGDFEPGAWIASAHPAASGGTISLDELVRMDVIYGPRAVSPATYDSWLPVL